MPLPVCQPASSVPIRAVGVGTALGFGCWKENSCCLGRQVMLKMVVEEVTVAESHHWQ